MMCLTKFDNSDHFEVLIGVCKCFKGEVSTFQNIGVPDIKNGDFRYPPWTKCNNLVKEIVCRNLVQGHVQYCRGLLARIMIAYFLQVYKLGCLFF